MRRLPPPWHDVVLVRCERCGVYGSASDAQLDGRAETTCVVRWCGWTITKDWRPALEAVDREAS